MPDGAAFYWRAFREVSYDRPVGFQVGHAPYSSIVTWCCVNGVVDADEVNFIIRIIRTLEHVEFEHKGQGG